MDDDTHGDETAGEVGGPTPDPMPAYLLKSFLTLDPAGGWTAVVRPWSAWLEKMGDLVEIEPNPVRKIGGVLPQRRARLTPEGFRRRAAMEPDRRNAEAIRAGCVASEVHLTCNYPDCACKQMPRAIKAALGVALQPMDEMRRDLLTLAMALRGQTPDRNTQTEEQASATEEMIEGIVSRALASRPSA